MDDVARVAAIAQIGDVARDVAIAKAGLRMQAASRRMQVLLALMVSALRGASAHAPFQQSQSGRQAMACDDAITVGRTTVAPGQDTERAGVAFQRRQVALVSLDASERDTLEEAGIVHESVQQEFAV